MSIMSPRNRFLFALVVLLSVVAAAFLLLRHSPASLEKTDSALDFQEEKDYWYAQIVRVGGDDAYREMIQKGRGMSASQSHVMAHSFGEALFQTEGVEGFSLCGIQFLYGCYHQFIGNAIAALGLPVVERFRVACASKSLLGVFPCLHGLGHGILGYLGYSLDDLKKALTMCKASNLGEERSGCIDGVFMEYNIHGLTAYKSGTIEPRKFSVENTYNPCFDVDVEYRAQCVYQLPDWWLAAIPGPGDIGGRFAQAGIYCSHMQDKTLIQTCFEGVGHIAPPLSNLNPDVAAALCAAAAAPDYRTSCLSSAALRFKLEGFKDYFGLCERFGLVGSDLVRCRRFENKAS
ncbi:hypothetical protein EXS56_02955 [Candidatus Kaiserbacteria bacterium]|nr:hypothetical protein [Candidatus Kaiserbacteria bacterium]